MKKIDLICSNCGANMQITDDKTQAICPYCKTSFLLEKESSLEELAQKQEKLTYARKTAEAKAMEDSIKRQKKRKIKIIIIIISILATIGIIGNLIIYFSLEYMENPFDCISVKFTGVNGKGKVKIEDNGKCENFSDINYTFSKENNLNENEKINLNATSEKYRFGVKTQKYTVTGLSKYLNNLDDLNEKMIKKLHDYSYDHLKNNLGYSFEGKLKKLTPYKLFLYTNNENDNILYDVYKISVETKTGKIYDKFVVAYYEDFLILNNDELFSYSRLYHCGNTILAGDPSAYNSLDKNYAGFITGFININDFKSYINKKNDGTFEIKER